MFAIVSEENIDNWLWFLEHFREAIGDQRDLIFVSDRNHGIIESAKNVFPGSPRGYCYKHLTRTLRDKFRDPENVKREKVLKLFADCAYAPTRTLFDINFAKSRAESGVKIMRFLKDCPKKTGLMRTSRIHCLIAEDHVEPPASNHPVQHSDTESASNVTVSCRSTDYVTMVDHPAPPPDVPTGGKAPSPTAEKNDKAPASDPKVEAPDEAKEYGNIPKPQESSA